MTSAVVVGLSHSAAIADALAADETGGISIHRLASKNRPFEQDTISVEEALALVTSLPTETPVFLAMLGTCHNYLGLLRSGPDFDFLLGADDGPDATAVERIPQRALAMAFESYLGESRPIEKIRAAASSRVFLLSAPPPKESSQFMLDHLLRQAKQMKYGKSVAEMGIERPETRLKLWSLESRLTAEWAKARGIKFVPAPPKSFNGQGFLARKYYANDSTHANGAYGALVVEQIRAIAAKMRKEPANG